MSSTSETGHAKNVANFEKLIAGAAALGAAYNPSRANLKLAALNTHLTAANQAIGEVNSAASVYKIAVAARDTAFKPLDRLITRISNALKASETTHQVIADAATLVRKLQGRRSKPKLGEAEKMAAEAEGKKVVEISASQRSYVSRLDNLDKLIKLLSDVPGYAPNEDHLKTTALTALYDDLSAKSQAVTVANVALSNCRIARNELLYDRSTGVLATSKGVKTYIKSVFGASGGQYKAISGLKFIYPKQK